MNKWLWVGAGVVTLAGIGVAVTLADHGEGHDEDDDNAGALMARGRRRRRKPVGCGPQVTRYRTLYIRTEPTAWQAQVYDGRQDAEQGSGNDVGSYYRAGDRREALARGKNAADIVLHGRGAAGKNPWERAR